MQAYGFQIKSLKFIYSYLNDRKQRFKINNWYSSFVEILFSVPQSFILDIARYADDNTPYCTYENFGDVLACLEKTASDLFHWFSSNGLKANADKCHLLLTTNEKLTLNVSNFRITNSNKEKLPRVTIDNYSKFESHIERLCSKASQKLHVLSRMSSYISPDQHRSVMKSFINSQFG